MPVIPLGHSGWLHTASFEAAISIYTSNVMLSIGAPTHQFSSGTLVGTIKLSAGYEGVGVRGFSWENASIVDH